MSIFTIEIVIFDAPELACVVASEGLSPPLPTPREPTKFSEGPPQFFCGSGAFKIGRPHTKSSGGFTRLFAVQVDAGRSKEYDSNFEH